MQITTLRVRFNNQKLLSDTSLTCAPSCIKYMYMLLATAQ